MVEIPAKYETVYETVVVKEASQRLEIVPAVYETRDVVGEVQPATTKQVIIPAKYEIHEEEVMVKEASQRLEVIPAEYGTENISYKQREYGSTLKAVQVKCVLDTETI